jgi:hypothetical protein
VELRFRLWVVLAALIVFLGATGAQARYSHTTPKGVGLSQYANIAPLPGAGVALNATGRLDGNGAFQVNIPVAYTPGWGYVSASAYGGAHVGGPAGELGNGSGVFAAGFFHRPSVFLSSMKTSHVLDESYAVSVQGQLLSDMPGTPALAVGEQDVLGKELGGVSPYVVLTKSLQLKNRTLFATLGYGGGRFLDKPFGGLSTPLGRSFNLAIESDGYQLNAGLGWRPSGRSGKLTFLGAYNGKCGWLLGLNVAGAFSSR